MSTFPLQIVTLDGLFFEGEAEKLIVRTITGDVCILPRHCNYVTALGMGEAQVFFNGTKRLAACIGGMLSVMDGRVRLVPTTFEWAEDIDPDRAAKAAARAQEILEQNKRADQAIEVAQARLKRALVRSNVARHIK